MNKTKIIPTIAIIGVAAVAGKTTLAYGMNGNFGQRSRDDMSNHRAQMTQIIDANDYDAFLSSVEGTRMADIIDSEYKFNQLVKAHTLREKGDYTGAREIMDKLGMIRGPTHIKNAYNKKQ